MGNAFATGFTSGMHLALWVSGLMMLAGAPIAFLTIRRTAPHHVAAREVVARQVEASEVEALTRHLRPTAAARRHESRTDADAATRRRRRCTAPVEARS